MDSTLAFNSLVKVTPKIFPGMFFLIGIPSIWLKDFSPYWFSFGLNLKPLPNGQFNLLIKPIKLSGPGKKLFIGPNFTWMGWYPLELPQKLTWLKEHFYFPV